MILLKNKTKNNYLGSSFKTIIEQTSGSLMYSSTLKIDSLNAADLPAFEYFSLNSSKGKTFFFSIQAL